MTNIIKNLKKYGAGILGILVIVFGYYFFAVRDSSESLALGDGVDPVRSVEVARIVALLEDLKSINVDSSIFDNPILIKLEDFELEIPKEAQSRDNPFAPVF